MYRRSRRSAYFYLIRQVRAIPDHHHNNGTRPRVQGSWKYKLQIFPCALHLAPCTFLPPIRSKPVESPSALSSEPKGLKVEREERALARLRRVCQPLAGRQRRPSTLSFDLLRTVSEAEPLRAMSLSNGRTCPCESRGNALMVDQGVQKSIDSAFPTRILDWQEFR